MDVSHHPVDGAPRLALTKLRLQELLSSPGLPDLVVHRDDGLADLLRLLRLCGKLFLKTLPLPCRQLTATQRFARLRLRALM